MKKCTAKVMMGLVVLCTIHACLAKPKWLWVDEKSLDDSEMTANDAEARRFKNVKRKLFRRKMFKDCTKCQDPNCYGECTTG